MAELLSNLLIDSVNTSIAATTSEISEAIKKVSDTLRKINVTVSDATGNFRTFGEVFSDIYDAMEEEPDLLPSEKAYKLLRSETPIKTEISNQKKPFDFLEQNAYDHIQPIFNPEIEHIVSLDNI